MPTELIETMRTRWTDPNSRPLIKGSLIDADGRCCAHGDVFRVCGLKDSEIRKMEQVRADREIADRLGISLFHSVLLRTVNDFAQGCPEKVLDFSDAGLGSVLGPSWRSVVAFGEHMSAMTEKDRAAAWAAAWAPAWAPAWAAAWAPAGAAAGAAAWAAAGAAAGAAAWAAAGAAAGVAAGVAARAAAGVAAGDAARAAARDAAGELVGWTKLDTEPYFLKFFGITDAKAFVEAAEKRWR